MVENNVNIQQVHLFDVLHFLIASFHGLWSLDCSVSKFILSCNNDSFRHQAELWMGHRSISRPLPVQDNNYHGTRVIIIYASDGISCWSNAREIQFPWSLMTGFVFMRQWFLSIYMYTKFEDVVCSQLKSKDFLKRSDVLLPFGLPSFWIVSIV